MRAMGWIPIGVLWGSMTACGPIADDRAWQIDGEFDAVEVNLSNGDLRIWGTDGDRIEIDTDFGGVAQAGSVTRYVDGDTLVIDYDCALCGGDLSIGVPRDMPVYATLDHGDLGVDGIDGDVVAHVRAGSILGTDLGGEVEARARAGGVELEFGSRPRGVDAESGLGAVLVEVPRGPYFLDVGADIGVVQLTDVSHDVSSDARITAAAHAGEIRIIGR